ncbi:MAG TPA: filamentous hemagglutinin N-terminal domain-containing protein [Hyphomicrobiaceae bacterium]|nr:filamentous hemagglutinin N-terminal domain-containing protein [Hyphomicrobiaceae bacterium]
MVSTQQRVFRLAGLCLAAAGTTVTALPSGAHAQSTQVVPDGGTKTRATTAVDGSITVEIAPPTAKGLSHNTYSNFNVPRAGVALSNTDAKARTILNEVRSNNRSAINGALSVSGPRANVIVANPNGITVDGGSFVNTGGVGLITGKVTAIGDTTRLELSSGGDVLIGDGGLSGTMEQLDIVSRSIRVRGQISVPDKAVSLSTGSGHVDVASNADPGSPAGWLETLGSQGTAQGVTVVLESGAIIRGGSITITANDAGAGVRLNGTKLAASGSFILSASGQVTVTDSEVQSVDHAFVSGRSVTIDSRNTQSRVRSTASGIQVVAKEDLRIDGAVLQGNVRSKFGFAALGAVALSSGGALAVEGSSYGASLISDADALAIEAKGDITGQSGRWTSARDVLISTAGGLRLSDTAVTAAGNVIAFATGDAAINGSTIQAADSVTFDARAFEVASTEGRRAEIKAKDGGVLVTAKDGIANRGALVQGADPVRGDSRSAGGVTLLTDGLVLIETRDEAQIGSFFAEKSALVVNAKAGITNLSGRLLSNSDIDIATGGTFLNTVARTEPLPLSSGSGGLSSLLYGRQRSAHDFGTYSAGKEIALVTAANAVRIDARRIDNIGGEIAGTTVALSADRVRNEAVRLGRLETERSCVLFFCTWAARGSITRDGGVISADDSLVITAANSFGSVGGTLTAKNRIEVSAPAIRFGALWLPRYYERPAGLSSLFQGEWGRTFYGYDGGAIAVGEGTVAFLSDAPVIIEGTSIVAASPPVAANGVVQTDVPAGLAAANQRHIGLLRTILP